MIIIGVGYFYGLTHQSLQTASTLKNIMNHTKLKMVLQFRVLCACVNFYLPLEIPTKLDQ